MVKQMIDQQSHKVKDNVVVQDLKQELCELADEIDKIKQRSLKGNLIITSAKAGNKTCLIKSDMNLKDKYDVTVPPTDVQACQRLELDKNVILRIWNRGEGSSWADLCTAIKSGMKPEIYVFAYFQLTDRRNNLSFHLRML